MNRSTKYGLAILVAAATIIGGNGCSTADSYAKANNDVKLDIKPSSDHIFAGETVTVFSRTENTLGRDAKLDWETSGGNVKTEDNGRVARVTFDKPGTYSIDAVLTVDGKEAQRDRTVVQVAAIGD
ncbi:MAG: hypothetical protein QM770_00760 [Tepidisphaeraceae bacterium]